MTNTNLIEKYYTNRKQNNPGDEVGNFLVLLILIKSSDSSAESV